MSWELITGVLPWLLFLACPLFMLWMMRGMSHSESCGKQPEDDGMKAAATPAGGKDEEVRLLKERIARLETDKTVMENWR